MIKFKVGCANRGRSACKRCQQDITKDSLQLGVMTHVFVFYIGNYTLLCYFVRAYVE